MRRLAITKRVSLDGIADGWESDCYALVTPASYAEYLEFVKLSTEGKSNAELLQYELDFVNKHFVSGQGKFLEDDGSTTLGNLTTEDVAESKELADKLFAEIVGVNLDPKASSTVTETSPIDTATN